MNPLPGASDSQQCSGIVEFGRHLLQLGSQFPPPGSQAPVLPVFLDVGFLLVADLSQGAHDPLDPELVQQDLQLVAFVP